MVLEEAIQLVDRSADAVPALAMYGPRLFMAWRDAAPDAGGRLLLSTFTPAAGWSRPEPPAGITAVSAKAPALAALGDTLYLCWIDVTQPGVTDFQVLVSGFSAATNRWSTPTAIPQAASKQAPALAAYGNRLWVAYVRDNGKVAYAFRPEPTAQVAQPTWSVPADVPASSTAFLSGPSLTVFGSQLMLAYRASSGQQISVYAYTDAWASAPSPLASQCQTESAPTLLGFGGTLYLFTFPPVGTSGVRFFAFATFTETSGWTSCTSLGGATPSEAPRAAVYHDGAGDRLVLAWPGGLTSTAGAVGFARLGRGATLRPEFSTVTRIAKTPDVRGGVSVATFDSKLYAAWVKATSFMGPIEYSVFDPVTGWGAPQTPVPPPETPDAEWRARTAPAIAAFNGKLYFAWRDPGEAESVPAAIRFSSLDADGGAAASVLIAGTETREGPALAVFKDRLYLAWSDAAFAVQSRSMDVNGVWSAVTPVPGARTSLRPALASYGDRLYAGWAASRQILWSRSADGASWSATPFTVPGLDTTTGVALAAYGGALYFAAFTAGSALRDGVLRYVCYDDGDTPDGRYRFLGTVPGNPPSPDPPALASYVLNDSGTLALVYNPSVVIGRTHELESRFLAGTVTVDARFMRGYEQQELDFSIDRPVAVTPASGQPAFLSVNRQLDISYVFRDSQSPTGWRRQATGLRGRVFGAATTNDGRVVVFAARVRAILCVVQSAAGTTPPWGPVKTISLPDLPRGARVARVVARTVGGKVYLGVGARGARDRKTLVVGPGLFYLGEWTETTTTLGQRVGSDLTIAGTPGFDIGMVGDPLSAPSLALVVFADPVRIVPISDTGIEFALGMTIGTITAAQDGEARVFVAGQGARTIYLLNGADVVAIAYAPSGVVFGQLAASLTADGLLEVFAVGSDRRLYYVRQTSTSLTTWGDLLPLDPNVSGVATARDRDGHTEAFVASGPRIRHWVRRAGTNWTIEPVALPTATATILPTITYDLEVTIAGPDGVARPNTRVSLRAQTPTIIVVNGDGYSLDDDRRAEVTTDRRGKLTMSLRANALSTEPIEIESMANGIAATVITPNADLEYRFRTITTSDVLAATDLRRRPLLTGDSRDADAAMIAAATVASMRLAPESGDMSTDGFRQAGGRGTGLRFKARSASAAATDRSEPGMPWHLDLRDGQVSFRLMTQAEALAMVDEMETTVASLEAGDEKVIEGVEWGDVWRAIRAGVAQVTQVVAGFVDSAAAAVGAAITLVIGGVTYVYRATVTLVQQAFDIVQGIWQRFSVKFEQLFEWLGFVFDWGSILRTQEVISYALDQMLGFVVKAIAGLQSTIDAGFDSLKNDLDTRFQRAITSLGRSNLGDLSQEGQAGGVELERESAHNLVFNAFMVNVGEARPVTTGSTTGGSTQTGSPPGDSLASTLAASTDFQKTMTFFERFAADPGQALGLVLADVLEAIQAAATVVLDALKDAIDALVQLVANGIEAFRTMLAARWDIPFLSALYEYVTRPEPDKPGQALSLGGLAALIIAIPGTALYAATRDEAPFTQTSVAMFKAGFTADSLYQKSGLAPKTSGLTRRSLDDGMSSTADPTPFILTNCQQLFPVLYSATYFLYGGIDAFLDAFEIGQEAPLGAGFFALALETATQAFSVPCSYFSSDPTVTTVYDLETPTNIENSIWAYQWAGVFIDLLFLVAPPEANAKRGVARNASTKGVYYDSGYGIGHAVLYAVLAVAENNSDPLKTAQNFVGVAPEVLKLVRLPAIVTLTRKLSLRGLALVDVVGNTGLAVINLIRADRARREALVS